MSALVLKAGHEALARLRDEGIHPAQFSHVAAAAGGPKWLALNQLDRVLFGDWLAQPATPLIAVGSSIGAWRLAALAQADLVQAIENFEAAYLAQSYSDKPDAHEVADEAGRVLDQFVGADTIEDILHSSRIRLNVVTCKVQGLLARDNHMLQTLGLLRVIAANCRSRQAFARRVQRIVFHADPGQAQYQDDGFRSEYVPLSPDNLRAALLGTAAIPLVIAAVKDIAGAPSGVYMDGGLIDYHMDLPIAEPQGLMLLPHFSERVVPGWFDRYFKSRQPQHLGRALLLAPSAELLARLPNGKVPDRKDFALYGTDNAARIRDWKIAIAECGRMADDWQRWLADGSLVDRIQPL